MPSGAGPTLDPNDQVRGASDEQTEADTTDDVERCVRPEVETREGHENDDRPREDAPPASEVRSERPCQPGHEDDVSGNEGEARGRRAPTHDRAGDRRPRSRALNDVPDHPLCRELADGDDHRGKSETPFAEC